MGQKLENGKTQGAKTRDATTKECDGFSVAKVLMGVTEESQKLEFSVGTSETTRVYPRGNEGPPEIKGGRLMEVPNTQ